MKFRDLSAGALALAISLVLASGVFTVSDITSVRAQVTPGTSPLPIGKGGTGASTAPGARTGLGLGTMATQSANGVAVTGGTITGMPNPSAANDVANKSYVDAVATGLNVLAPSTLATAAVLPNTPTYANGASGVGATLTAGSNTTLTVDGTAAPLSTVVLVKNQASAFQNGIYTVTQAGSGAAPWILTRATYFDQAAEMKAGSYTFISGGATLVGSSFTLQTAITTVGTDAVNWALFASSTGNVAGPASAVSANIAAYNGVTGKIIQDSGVPTAALPTVRGQIPADNTGTVASAGNIGELISANISYASRVAMSNASIANSVMQSLNLNLGDYDCTGNHGFETTGSAFATEYHIEISTTNNASLATAPNNGCTNGTHNNYLPNQGQVFPQSTCRITATVNPTAVYHKSYSTYGTNGTNGAGGQTMYGYERCTRPH